MCLTAYFVDPLTRDPGFKLENSFVHRNCELNSSRKLLTYESFSDFLVS